MPRHEIAWMPGDGIGPEVMEAARLVLDALGLDAEYVAADVGWELWRAEGDPLPARTLDVLDRVDTALFGAITSKPREEAEAELAPALRGTGRVYRSPIVALRQRYDLATNLRPCKAYPGNPRNHAEGIDLVVFRQNTEGLYAGLEYHPVPGPLAEVLGEHPRWAPFAALAPEDVALTVRVVTRPACRAISARAFAYAAERGYPSVTVVEKPNVLRETSGLFVRAAREVARDFPRVELKEVNVDAMAMQLVGDPLEFGVIVASNLFGDVVSDLAAQLVGGPGFAGSANLGPRLAVFEPVHGSAPDLAGRGVANPIAMLLAAKLMLEHLGEGERAARLENAVAATIAGGAARTPDLGGTATTLAVAEAVAGRV